MGWTHSKGQGFASGDPSPLAPLPQAGEGDRPRQTERCVDPYGTSSVLPVPPLAPLAGEGGLGGVRGVLTHISLTLADVHAAAHCLAFSLP
jgi:hypothetical protein